MSFCGFATLAGNRLRGIVCTGCSSLIRFCPLTDSFGGITLTAMELERAAAERFIGDYFQERTSTLRMRLEVHQQFWQRFYDSQCIWDSRRGVIEKSESEQVVSVFPSPVGALVVTTGETIYRSRYDLRPNHDSWLIHEVDTECGLCRLKGPANECARCGGTGWVSWMNRASRHELPVRSKSLDSSLGPEQHQVHDMEVKNFMGACFSERTLSQKREFEFLAAFAMRFFSKECEWARWGPSIQGGESERVLKIMPLGEGVHVFSNGITGLFLRYYLRPKEKTWLIQQVDPECLICRRNGPSPNCFWCGGTIWDHKRSSAG